MRHLMTQAIPYPRIRALIWLIWKVELSLGDGPCPCGWETELRALASVRKVGRIRTKSENFLFDKGIINYYNAYWDDLVHRKVTKFIFKIGCALLWSLWCMLYIMVNLEAISLTQINFHSHFISSKCVLFFFPHLHHRIFNILLGKML